MQREAHLARRASFFSTELPVHLLNPDPPAHLSTFFKLFFGTFLGVLSKGCLKTPWTFFCKKPMSKAFFEVQGSRPPTGGNRQELQRQFVFAFLVVSWFLGSWRWKFKSHCKEVFENKSCRQLDPLKTRPPKSQIRPAQKVNFLAFLIALIAFV
jgi:hypothetical protein